jgi:hypothetical protein
MLYRHVVGDGSPGVQTCHRLSVTRPAPNDVANHGILTVMLERIPMNGWTKEKLRKMLGSVNGPFGIVNGQMPMIESSR